MNKLHFIIKEDGKLYVDHNGKWIEVDNDDDVINRVFETHQLPKNNHNLSEWRVGVIYSLEGCEMKLAVDHCGDDVCDCEAFNQCKEKKALITFSEKKENIIMKTETKQWTNEPGNFTELREWSNKRIGSASPLVWKSFKITGLELEVSTPGGMCLAHIGDYITKDEKGNLSVSPIHPEKKEDKPTPEHIFTDHERNWKEDFSHENGNYMNKCIECDHYFRGHKRRSICKLCSQPTPEKKEEETQGDIWEDLFRYMALHGNLSRPHDHFIITRKNTRKQSLGEE